MPEPCRESPLPLRDNRTNKGGIKLKQPNKGPESVIKLSLLQTLISIIMHQLEINS